MKYSEIYRRAANNEGQLMTFCRNTSEPKAIIQFVHDLSEHSGRYAEALTALCEAGFDVYANDITGHGFSKQGHKGSFAMRDDSLDSLLDDIDSLFDHAEAVSGDIPKVLIGMGFGACLVELYQSKYGKADLIILVGPLTTPKALPFVASAASNHRWLFGINKRSKAVQNMIYQTHNVGTDPVNKYYWLSKDPEVCTEFDEDEDCGFPLTSSAYNEVLKAFKMSKKNKLVKKIEDIPVFVLAGSEDQVGECGKAALDKAAQFTDTDHTNVTVKLYENCCHDLFHEFLKDEVLNDVKEWIKNNLSAIGMDAIEAEEISEESGHTTDL